MAGAKIEYDESGSTASYFLLSFFGLILIPCTYYFFPRYRSRECESNAKILCHCDGCHIKRKGYEAKVPQRKCRNGLVISLLALGWMILIGMIYKVLHIQHDYVQWDPFKILQIDAASSMSEIKRAYRRLSLIFHPDKDTGDEKEFMMIAKAYAALTDDEARNNWEKYGNPDGPGATSFGIALPSWIVEEQNSALVLGLYTLVIIVALPIAVGIWWNRSIKFGRDKILRDTTTIYRCYVYNSSQMFIKRVIMILAASMEFNPRCNKDIVNRPDDDLELSKLIKDLDNVGGNSKDLQMFEFYSKKPRILIYAHLSRKDLPETLHQDRLYIIKKCTYLLQEFVQCITFAKAEALREISYSKKEEAELLKSGKSSLKRKKKSSRKSSKKIEIPNLQSLQSAMKLCPMIVQALREDQSPLLQLPHMNEDVLRHFTTRKRNIKNLQQLARMKSKDRRSLLRSLSQEQYDDVMHVLSTMPLLKMEITSDDIDEEDSSSVTVGDIVTIRVTLIREELAVLFNQEGENEVSEVQPGDFKELEGAKKVCEQTKNVQTGDFAEIEEAKNGKNDVQIGDLAKRELYPTLENQTDSTPQEKPKSQKPWKQTTWRKKKKANKGNAAKIKEKTTMMTVETTIAAQQLKITDTNNSTSLKSSKLESGDKVDEDIITKAIDEKGEASDEESDEKEDDEQWSKLQLDMSKKQKILEPKSKISHSVHCPFFPEDKQEYWWIYVADLKRDVFMSAPLLITNLIHEEEVGLNFIAPDQPGSYTLSVIATSDSFLGLAVMKPIKLEVKEAKIIATPENASKEHISDDESKEDEEDSGVEDSELTDDNNN